MTVAASGCFIDLGREESTLLIIVDGTSSMASTIVVEVDDGGDLPPFQGQFLLNGDPSQPLPAISIASGSVVVTAVTIDESGNNVDGPVREMVMLRNGANGLQLDFSAPPPKELTRPNESPLWRAFRLLRWHRPPGSGRSKSRLTL